MKKLLVIAVLTVSWMSMGGLVVLGQSNGVPSIIVPPPVVVGTNAVAGSGHVAASSVSNYLVFIIPLVVPGLISLARQWAPKLPGWSLPIIAPAVGALLDWLLQLSGSPTNGLIGGALLGSAGVGLREIHDQLQQKVKSPPVNPPVAPAPPTP